MRVQLERVDYVQTGQHVIVLTEGSLYRGLVVNPPYAALDTLVLREDNGSTLVIPRPPGGLRVAVLA